MSDSAWSRDLAESSPTSTPRALIHKKILDVAGEMPDATMAEVGDEVSGASTDLVERVLREYGDPAAVESDPDGQTASDGGTASTNGVGQTDDSNSDSGSDMADGDAPDTGPSGGASTDETAVEESAETAPDRTDSDSTPAGSDGTGAEETGTDRVSSGATADEPTEGDPMNEGKPATEEDPVIEDATVDGVDALTQKERAVLEVLAERPTATQKEVADVLGVSRATVSKRASGIEGFDWQHRAAFVERVFDGVTSPTNGSGGCSTVDSATARGAEARTDADRSSPVDAASEDATTQVLSRLDRIETHLERLGSDGESAGGGITDPELAHKVVHACMESEHVDEEEELRIVAAVLNGDAGD